MHKDLSGISRLLAVTSVLLGATAMPGALALPAGAQDAPANACASGYTEAPNSRARSMPVRSLLWPSACRSSRW
ncbi:hypothetical protein [Devosia submarina]|uniref:hypothetical protein n=1 Tax=Devosia submarina TaxID=1173082 RepID=UPI0014743EBD|nr:hypothetical protein [Devosia submarina]